MPKKGSTPEQRDKRMNDIMKLRLMGYSHREIYANLKPEYKQNNLPISLATIHTDLKKGRALLIEEQKGTAEELRSYEISRLDKAQTALWSRVGTGDTKAVTALIKIIEQRAKLYGLYANTHQMAELDALKRLVEAGWIDSAILDAIAAKIQNLEEDIKGLLTNGSNGTQESDTTEEE